jgi:hypothetical protein
MPRSYVLDKPADLRPAARARSTSRPAGPASRRRRFLPLADSWRRSGEPRAPSRLRRTLSPALAALNGIAPLHYDGDLPLSQPSGLQRTHDRAAGARNPITENLRPSAITCIPAVAALVELGVDQDLTLPQVPEGTPAVE